MLESDHYNVLIAHNAEGALRIAERDDLSFDLMLMDVRMPDISATELADRILAMRANLTLLLMGADSQMMPATIRDRAFGFMLKPFTSNNLLERVHSALSYPAGAPDSDNPNEGGTPSEGCAGVVCPLLPRRPRRPPMAGKVPLPE
jgi:DNA-binding NtrC family response regulator